MKLASMSFRRVVKGIKILLLMGLLTLIYIGLQGSTGLAQSIGEPTAQAEITPTSSESDLSGQVTISTTPDGLLIQATLTNAPPGDHGFHIHEGASCADGGNAAKGHFNPDDVQHGKLVTDGFSNAHAGDLGNITIGADGTGTLSETILGLSLTEGKYAIANHAVILHEKVDNFGQPTGNAGGRIGCGIIQVASDA